MNEEVNNKYLKPCPFCGCEAQLNIIEPHIHNYVDMPDYSGNIFIECTNCTCILSADSNEIEVAKKVWNTRSDR